MSLAQERVSGHMKLQRYLANTLECPLAALFLPGLAVLPSVRRALPAGEWLEPVWGVGLAQQAVISHAPALEGAVLQGVRGLPSPGALWTPRWNQRLLEAVRQRCPGAVLKLGFVRACQQPGAGGAEHLLARVERIEPGMPGAGGILARLDGPVFGIRGYDGRILSWAGAKLKSADIWELAVATESAFRGRGLARACVSVMARFALEQGRLPIYLHDVDNRASARVADAVGFIPHARTLRVELPPGSHW